MAGVVVMMSIRAALSPGGHDGPDDGPDGQGGVMATLYCATVAYTCYCQWHRTRTNLRPAWLLWWEFIDNLI